MMTPLVRLCLDRGAAHLHTLGPRATAELLATLADRIGGPAMLELLADYRRLTPGTVRKLGGDRFPPHPVHLADCEA